MTIGQAFKRMREKNGYSKDELADKLGVHKNNIFNWENDKHFPSLFLLMCVADVFGCTLDELVGRTTTPEQKFLKSGVKIKNERIKQTILPKN